MRQKRSLLVFVLIAMGIAVFIHYVRANSSDISDKLSFAAQDRNYPLHAPGCNCTEIREGEGPPRWCSSRRAREEHRAPQRSVYAGSWSEASSPREMEALGYGPGSFAAIADVSSPFARI
jgi:hypothetical protein